MSMTSAYLNAIRDHGQSLITHVGLVDDAGVAIAGLARQPVAWTDDGNGVSRLAADEVFPDIPAGESVGGWRGYSALTVGTDYGGDDFTPVTFGSDAGVERTFTLLASLTTINHTAS